MGIIRTVLVTIAQRLSEHDVISIHAIHHVQVFNKQTSIIVAKNLGCLIKLLSECNRPQGEPFFEIIFGLAQSKHSIIQIYLHRSLPGIYKVRYWLLKYSSCSVNLRCAIVVSNASPW